MDYGFKLTFNDLSQELLDEKFEEWKQYMESVEPDLFDEESTNYNDEQGLRQMFEDDVQAHFPVYF